MVEIYLSDLNEEQIDIISIIGLENFLKLCEHFQGETIYFPKMKTVKNKHRNKLIKSEYNGKNIYYLSQKYKISPRQIRRIINLWFLPYMFIYLLN